MDAAERELTEKIKKGNVQAFKEAYLGFFKPVFTFILRYLEDQDAARDITQESFYSLWRSRESLLPEKGYKSYLLCIARNNAINWLRKEKLAHKYEEECEILESVYLDKLVEQDYWRQMTEFIDTLPHKHKEVFMLRNIYSLSNKEIAERLDINIKTVEYRMMVALRAIRKKIESLLDI